MSLDEWIKTDKRKSAEIADAIGISRVQLWRLRNGSSRCSVDTAKRIESLSGGIVKASRLLGLEAA